MAKWSAKKFLKVPPLALFYFISLSGVLASFAFRWFNYSEAEFYKFCLVGPRFSEDAVFETGL